MTVKALVGGARGRSPVSKPARPPAYVFEPTFIREQLREAREAVLQEEEDYGYREPSDDPLDSVSA